MSIISSIGGLQSALLNRTSSLTQSNPAQSLAKSLDTQTSKGVQEPAFGQLFEGLIDSVETKQAQAGELTKQVLLGNNDQLHQSVIAMQEASVSFSLMVEVRNKLMDSYQELMRMPV